MTTRDANFTRGVAAARVAGSEAALRALLNRAQTPPAASGQSDGAAEQARETGGEAGDGEVGRG